MLELQNFSMGESTVNRNQSLSLSTWSGEFFYDCSPPSEPTPTMKHYLIVTAYCFFYAIAAAIFYKKSFSAKVIPAILLCLFEGYCLQNHDILFGERCGQLFTLSFLAFIIHYASRNPTLGSSFDIASYSVFFMTLFDANMGLLETFIHCPYNRRALLIAIPQFIRKPEWLKSRLQQFRSKLGPMFVFYTVLAQQEMLASRPDDSTSDLSVFLAGVAAVCAVVAGVLSRPDNATVMEQFYPGTTISDRRRYHGCLMLASFIGISLITIRQYNL